MFWLSILNRSPELDAIAGNTRPWAIIKAFWRFSNAYGEYQSQPPSHRRQFIIDREQCSKNTNSASESCF